MRGEVSEAFV